MAFKLYLLFTVSYFLHLTARIPFLGTVRFDLLLMGVIVLCIYLRQEKHSNTLSETPNTVLKSLVIYVLLALPFVEWPGTVLRVGIPNFVKAVVFFFFTVLTIVTEKELKVFLIIFTACQLFRVLEPVGLHHLYGYWGDTTFMAEGSMMPRLSGAPSDVINPNGLAYVTLVLLATTYAYSLFSWKARCLLLFVLPLSLHALILTGSRTGILSLSLLAIYIFVRSKKKLLVMAVITMGLVFMFGTIDQIQKERYLSIFFSDVRGAATAKGRIDGLQRDFDVALNRPFFGHGLGTSSEAKYNTLGEGLKAHNLYIEILQELGLIGLIIFLLYLRSLIVGLRICFRAAKQGVPSNPRVALYANVLVLWLILNFANSLGSYGLSAYDWYLFGGLTMVVRRNCGKTS